MSKIQVKIGEIIYELQGDITISVVDDGPTKVEVEPEEDKTPKPSRRVQSPEEKKLRNAHEDRYFRIPRTLGSIAADMSMDKILVERSIKHLVVDGLLEEKKNRWGLKTWRSTM